MIENKKITIDIATSTFLKVVGIFLILAFIYIIRDILLLLFVSLVLAIIIEPMVNKLEAKKIPRSVSVITIYIVLILFLALVVRMLIPPIVEQVTSLAVNFPEFWQKIVSNFQGLKQFSEDRGLLGEIQQGLQGLQSNLSRAAGGVYNFTVVAFTNIFNFFIFLVVTFYFTMQKDALGRALKVLAPEKYHLYLDSLAVRIQHKIGGWARGQLLLGLIIGLMSWLGLIILLPKYALVLAIVAGVTEIIPYVGPFIGAVPAVFLGLTVSWGHGLAVAILYIIIQQIENNIVVPQIMKKQVGLNPVAIIMAMLIGGRLAGLIGIIIAIPVTTVLGIVLRDFLSRSDGKPDSLSQE